MFERLVDRQEGCGVQLRGRIAKCAGDEAWLAVVILQPLSIWGSEADISGSSKASQEGCSSLLEISDPIFAEVTVELMLL